MSNVTAGQVGSAIKVIKAVADAIKEAGRGSRPVICMRRSWASWTLSSTTTLSGYLRVRAWSPSAILS